MTRHLLPLLFALAASSALMPISNTYADTASPGLLVLRCEFIKHGFKDEDDRICKAQLTVLPPSVVLSTRSHAAPPNNLFEVECDEHKIYSGPGFVTGSEIGFPPTGEFGVGLVTAIRNTGSSGLQPTYPTVAVDGDVDDNNHPFKDRDARLYFAFDDLIYGRCEHPVPVR